MNGCLETLRNGQRGSALVIAILVTAILTVLGLSFLLLADTENRIAETEKLSAQALYFAEAGARQVKRWFDHPGSLTFNLAWPPLAAVDRSQRKIDTDGAGPNAPVPADGTPAAPYYKQGVDRDGDGLDDIFDKPYRDALVDTLLGTEDGPDMVLDESGSPEARSFLADLSNRLLSDFPAAGAGIRARIVRIDVYGPPYLDVAGSWTRYGMGTIKVTARVYRQEGSSELVLAERVIKAVLNETPYPGPYGPLHSCKNLTWNGDFTVHWGPASAVNDSDLTNNHKKLAASWPRVVPPSQRLDLLWGWDNDTNFQAYKNAIEGMTVEDPWFRYLSGGSLSSLGCTGGTPTPEQPCPFNWTGGPLGDGQYPYHGGSNDGTHSNAFENVALVTCPEFDYDTWKTIATSGTSDVHYFVWDNGSSFKENGSGTARTFRDITDNREGLFFFDTKDGLPPHDDNGDGEFDNLTPAISIQGGTWGVRGFVYLNANSFQTKGVGGRPATFRAPGEPYQDKNQNGRYDPGENWLNLRYPTSLSDPFVADKNDTFGGSVLRNSKGPEVTADAVLWGILYNSGYFDATGNARYFGSVVAKQGIGETSPSAGTPDLYWDETIVEDWPPKTWDLPRVIITRWETDL